MFLEERLDLFFSGLYKDFLTLQAEVEEREGPSPAVRHFGREKGTKVDFIAYLKDCMPEIFGAFTDKLAGS